MNSTLIQILCDYIANKETNCSIDDETLRLAKIHQVEAIVYKQTKHDSLKSSYYYAYIQYNNRLLISKQIEQLFSSNGVDYFWVKGMEISKLYRDPFLRSMGDLDIIVHLDSKIKAAQVLKNEGFKEVAQNEYSKSEWIFIKDGVIVELHHSLIYGSKETEETENDSLIEYFSNCWLYVSEGKIDPNYHLLYLFVHLRKHFMNNGVGIRQFMDIAIFSMQDLDWNWIIKELKLMQLFSFSEHVYGLIYRWWGIRMPIFIEINDYFYEQGTDIILESGVFGLSKNGTERHQINQIRHGKSKIIVYLNRVFPPYEFMIKTGYCKGLIGNKFLLPLYWAKRIFLFIKRKEKIEDYLITDDAVRDRDHIFEMWGL